MSIFIYHTIKSDTGPKLAKVLHNGKAGYNIEINDNDFIVNYGRVLTENIAHLNKKLVTNKLTQLKLMRQSGLLVPDYIELRDINNISNDLYPVIARKYHHTKGRDAIFLKNKFSLRKRWRRIITKRDYFIKYIPKIAEFRVHVLGDTIAGISKKVKYCDIRQDTENEDDENHENIPLQAHPHIWSREKGWVQVDYNGIYSEFLTQLAIKACKALKYDFGAVDIIQGENKRFYFLEINSSPRLNLRRRRLYCKFFREKQKQWTEKNEL